MKRRQNGTTWTGKQMDNMVQGKQQYLLYELEHLRLNVNKETGAITQARIKLIEDSIKQLTKFALGDFT